MVAGGKGSKPGALAEWRLLILTSASKQVGGPGRSSAGRRTMLSTTGRLILAGDVSRKDGCTQQLRYIPTMSSFPTQLPPQTLQHGGSSQWATLDGNAQKSSEMSAELRKDTKGIWLSDWLKEGLLHGVKSYAGYCNDDCDPHVLALKVYPRGGQNIFPTQWRIDWLNTKRILIEHWLESPTELKKNTKAVTKTLKAREIQRANKYSKHILNFICNYKNRN